MIKENERQWIHSLSTILLSLVLLIASSGSPYFRSLSEWTSRFMYYPEFPVHSLRQGISSFGEWFHSKQELIEETKQLDLENNRLKTAIRYERTMDFAQSLAMNETDARVIYRPPGHWWSEIRIDKGSDDGLAVGLGILQKGILIGRVAAVERDFSWVELITSQTQMIPIVVEETRDLGVAVGDGHGNVWVLYLPEERPIEKGMTISTALVNEVLIPGIPIGRISTEHTSMLGGNKAYKLDLESELSVLYSVSVLNLEEGDR
ncbi:MAG: rod shape-determining protein MreC [Synergistales bacterium]|nr:rod shape-determining protein MreC [Synergistales bacterium]